MVAMRNIFIFALLFAALLLSESSMTCKESRKLHDTCGGYCFQVVKPILGHTAMLQEQVNSRNSLQQAEVKSDLEGIKRQLLAIRDSIALSEQKFVGSNKHIKRGQNIFRNIGSKFYYIEHNEQMNWFAAAHKCIELDGHLVSLQNKQEYDNLKVYLNTNCNYWIDINDLSKEGQFLSLTTGRVPTYLNWEPESNNPNNYLGRENCGGLWNHNGNLLMNDFLCDDLMYFICEL